MKPRTRKEYWLDTLFVAAFVFGLVGAAALGSELFPDPRLIEAGGGERCSCGADE